MTKHGTDESEERPPSAASPAARRMVGNAVIRSAGEVVSKLGSLAFFFQAHERMEFISSSIIIQRMTSAAVGIAVLALGAA